ncbi:MAG: ABC transporter permease [Mucilaginibacter sp.]
MIRNYIKTAWRNLVSNKFYSVINVAGLTVGLVIGLFILLWVQDELSFDSFNKQAPQIYKIGIIGGTGPTKQIFSQIIAPVAPFSKNELPEVKDAVRIKRIGNTPFRYKEKKFTEENVAFTDPSFFSVFDFGLISGDAKRPFADNYSIVITQSTAARYFGNDNPIGKVMTLGDDQNFKVSGVINDFPKNSSITYSILLPLSLFNQLAYIKNTTSYNGTGRIPSMDADWISFNYETYLLLKPNTDINLLTKKLQRIHERNKPDDAPVPYVAQSILQMHLYKADGSDGGIETVRTFGIVALLILVIACINYVNLSTARSMLRAKEVSMRKIIGAGKLQLFIQFMFETTLLFFLATILALGLMFVLLPFYNNFSGKQLVFSFSNYKMWECIVLALVGTLLASSIYPALLLSSFEPLKALKGRVAAGIGNTAFRRALVVIQFTISIVLIIGMLIINNQLKYIRNKNLGYDKENVFSFMMRDAMVKHYDEVKAELLKQPSIRSVARSSNNIINYDNWTGDNDWDGKPANSNLLFHAMETDKDLISFFNLKMAQGNNFIGAVADSTHFIINEAAVRAMDIKDPIGKNMRIWKTKGTIIGVIKDFHFSSMRKKIEPTVFVYDPKNSYRIYIKTTGNDAQKAISAAQQVWQQYNHEVPFSYAFLDETFSQLYNTEQHTGSLFNLFAFVTIFISCLGLFGLATYSAQVKTREIGIRKVLGASVAGIIRLLATEFVILIIVALAIAVPIGWYTMNKWLMEFAYRIDMQWWVFAVAGLTAIIVAFVTISFQSLKAALANPVKSLRSE